MVTSLNNSNNNFIRVLSKSSMSRYFPPFLTKSYLTIQIKSVINWMGVQYIHQAKIVTDKKIESAQVTSVRCKPGTLMICTWEFVTRVAGKYPLSVLKKTYELFVGTNETVLFMRVSVELDSNVLPSSPSMASSSPWSCRHCHHRRYRNHRHYCYHCCRYLMLPITTDVVLFFFLVKL